MCDTTFGTLAFYEEIKVEGFQGESCDERRKAIIKTTFAPSFNEKQIDIKFWREENGRFSKSGGCESSLHQPRPPQTSTTTSANYAAITNIVEGIPYYHIIPLAKNMRRSAPRNLLVFEHEVIFLLGVSSVKRSLSVFLVANLPYRHLFNILPFLLSFALSSFAGSRPGFWFSATATGRD